MIEATYQSLVPQQHQQKLDIKMQEITVLSNNFMTVNTTAALIAGFAYSGLPPIAGLDLNLGEGLEAVYYVGLALTVGLSMHTVIMSTVCTVMGADLAWRGADPSDSVGRALEGLLDARWHVYIPFVASIALFLVMLAIFTSAQLGFHDRALMVGAISVFAVFALLICLTVYTWRTLRGHFSKNDPMYRQTGLMPRAGQH
eukprot:TRINITY_DN37873_c0_g1_i1.p1 TRINITY_DN37873_c0_g1~~TRINITY_DN37873_c0_g1_i1.p1  ORF type:complete len:200 (+),score=57.19 TRINITY_DN37873_c0_g1_i1:63-662(+)